MTDANSDSDLGSVGPDEKKKLESFMQAGVRILQEIEDLRGGMTDTAKALAEDLNLKPRDLIAAVRTAHKNNLADKMKSMATVEDIVSITGHG